MAKYKVLWLDDDFQPLIANPDEEQRMMNTSREALRRDAGKAADYDISVECIYDKDEFSAKIKSYQQYQAVIFDLKGLNLNDSTDNDVMVDAYEMVKDLPLSIYVYSGNPEDREFKLTLRKIKNKNNVFGKIDGAKPLFRKIVADLDSELNFYSGHQECLSLFNEGYLNTQNRMAMDEILKKWYEQDKCYAPYNNMRKILEDMLDTLVQAGIVQKGISKDSFECFNKTMFNLTTACYKKYDVTKKQEVIDYDNPLVPFSTCRREIKYILDYLCNITNRYSHFLENEPNYIRESETIQDYNILVQKSVYPAFFAAMKWFFAVMENL